MVQQEKRKNNIIFGCAVVLFCLVLLTTSMVTGLRARFHAADESGDSARAAAFVFDVQDREESSLLSLTEVNAPDTQKTYTFQVTNKNGAVSEVAQAYTVQLDVSECSLPLKLTLSDGTEEKTLDMLRDNTVEKSGTLSFSATFPAGIESEKTYTLTILWDAQRSDIHYAEQTADLTLTCSSQQIN